MVFPEVPQGRKASSSNWAAFSFMVKMHNSRYDTKTCKNLLKTSKYFRNRCKMSSSEPAQTSDPEESLFFIGHFPLLQTPVYLCKMFHNSSIGHKKRVPWKPTEPRHRTNINPPQELCLVFMLHILADNLRTVKIRLSQISVTE